MQWTGKWRNQYGSLITIVHEGGDRIGGYFETALPDSGFFGQTVPIIGVASGDCIAFSSVGTGTAGDMVVSYTGLMRDGRMETMWYFVGAETVEATGARSPTPWWKAVIANADTFERVPTTDG
jgi:hypothetical protein